MCGRSYIFSFEVPSAITIAALVEGPLANPRQVVPITKAIQAFMLMPKPVQGDRFIHCFAFNLAASLLANIASLRVLFGLCVFCLLNLIYLHLPQRSPLRFNGC